MLTGQAKTDYQREYMRKRRAKGLTTGGSTGAKPKVDNVRPAVRPETTDGSVASTPIKLPPLKPEFSRIKLERPIETQSHSPMMVGYVPPQAEG